MAKSVWNAALGVVLIGSAMSAPAQSKANGDEAWKSKVDPWVLSTGATGKTEFLVFLREQADVRVAADLPSQEAKGDFVFRTLRDTATRAQAPVLAELTRLGVEVQRFWIANMIKVRGDLTVVRAMAERGDVLRVSANPSVKLQTLPPDPLPDPEAPAAIEWGITKTGAPGVWALGFKGAGVVVAGQDTGYQWDHPALKGKYRGWNGVAANHNYNWHDSIHSGGGVCGFNSPVPCDDTDHGTHTMGTMVGDDGAGNQIGMAPQAKWMGCRNMDQGNGTPATYSECFEWFIAPTNLTGSNPDPTKSPNVINNSWGCPPSEGCTDPLVLQTVVDNTRAAGIVVVVSAGNSGPSCGSVSDPAAIYASSFSIGATDSSDSIASFSSRGPVTIDGSNRPKPDVSAPGVSVRSSVPGNGYATFSGTSMAGPHVVGHVALLLSAMPAWKGQVDLVETRITQSALPRTTAETCGGVPAGTVPNNTYGWGRIDALASVTMADLGLQIIDTPDPVGIGATLTYRVFASNAGPLTGTGATVVVNLSASVSFVSASAGCGYSAGVVTCAFGSVAKGTFPEKDILVTVNSGGTIQSSATITGTLFDPNSGNNQAFMTTAAGDPADLSLTMSGAWDPALRGVPFSYTLTVNNLGPAVAGSVSISDTLPANAAFTGATAGCGQSGGVVTCALGTLNSGSGAAVTITVTPTSGVTMSNTATVSSGMPDPVPGNNSASVTTGVGVATPIGIGVDAHAGGGPGSNLNGVFEPGEQVVMNPTWQNPAAAPATITGAASAFGGPAGATYTLADAVAGYGIVGAASSADCWTSGSNCYELSIPIPATRPAAHWDATVTETLSTGASKIWTLHIGDSFTDVPRTHWAYRFVETIYHNNITAGCGAAVYCPNTTLSRAQMAVLLEKAKHGPAWTPPASTGTVFADVPIDYWAGDFIETLAAEGITAGCGAGLYCPENPTTRAEMAVFLLRAEHGSGWTPAAPTGTVFADVPIDFWAGGFIEALAAEGITSGCGGGNYCPGSPVTRAEMAVFLTKTFHLKLY